MARVATSKRSGIMSWVSSIRTTMANDPGRQFLEDQIQSNGFLFLEDYLENILAGPKHEALIELVKTPGRRKDAPKRTRAATAAAARAKAAIGMSLEDDDGDKENNAPKPTVAPINAFHKALLQSKNSSFDEPNASKASIEKPIFAKKPVSSPRKVVAIEELEVPPGAESDAIEADEDEEKAVEGLVTPPHCRALAFAASDAQPLPCVSFGDKHEHLPGEHSELTKELSIIAEDEEPSEQSRISMGQARLTKPERQTLAAITGTETKPISGSLATSTPIYKPPLSIDTMTIMDIDDCTQTTTFTASTSQSTQTFHSVPLHSTTSPRTAPTLGPYSDLDHPVSTSTPYHDHIIPLAPAQTDVAISNNAASERALSRKPSVPHFTTIGAPSPFRKSMRAPREPSMTVTHSAAVVGPSGTRSSWLVKTREAKAREVNPDRTSTMSNKPAFGLGNVAGMKRKSADMLGISPTADADPDGLERLQKNARVAEETTALASKSDEGSPFGQKSSTADVAMMNETEIDVPLDEHSTGDGSEGMINKLKMTVAGYSARAGKSLGKSLGGAAANALAEARAAAEAKVAERNAAEGRTTSVAMALPTPAEQPEQRVEAPRPVFAAPSTAQKRAREPKGADKRLSVSDLVTKYETKKGAAPERVFQPPPAQGSTATSSKHDTAPADTSTSTTPPNSPPRPRVFTLPDPTRQTFFPPPSFQMFSELGSVEPRPFSTFRAPQPLSAQSTFVSTQSSYPDSIFDHDTPVWAPSTQETEFDDFEPSQDQRYASLSKNDADANESWHLDDKVAEAWTPHSAMGFRDDDLTWSTAPTRSTSSKGAEDEGGFVAAPVGKSASSQNSEAQRDKVPSNVLTQEDESMDTDCEDEDLEVPGIRLLPSASQSALSLVSSQSSKAQSRSTSQASSNNPPQSGWLSSASKLVSSVLGGSKKGKVEPPKSLQLAASLAKRHKEQEEEKNARLNQMEARRQQILQKKAEEDKAREEKRVRDENERWRREREKEDNTEKRMVKQAGKKLTQMEDDFAKKRKLPESENKETLKDKKEVPLSRIGKPVHNPSQNILNSSTGPLKKSLKQSASQSTQIATTSIKVASTTLDARSNIASSSAAPPKLLNKGKAIDIAADKQPAQVMQTQMQARVQAHMEEVRKAEMLPPPVPSEAIELPEIHSEYSDSDDEDRVRTFDPPHWAQSPELREALQFQSNVNPDDIFGAIRPLRMEELFKERTSRFRARTSSANWVGTDALTTSEEREYARRMGYTK